MSHPSGAPAGLPRLLAAAYDPAAGHDDLARHLARYGPLPSRSPADVLAAVHDAGLTGRGGAGFPTAVKLRSVAAGRGPRTVLANAAEGEPASGKDAALLATAPHLVLDGVAAAARTVGARRALVAVKEGSPAEAQLLTALAERPVGRPAMEVVGVPRYYVASEESSLIRFVGGGPALPTYDSRPYVKGVGGRATLVQNVETLAHLALIVRFGADWFRQIGTLDAPGSRLLTVGGAVGEPGVYEVAQGEQLSAVLRRAGADPARLGGVLLGGYFGGWLPPGALDVPLTPAAVSSVGGSMGAGVVVALGAESCGLVESARVLAYLAGQSAGQCGPCRFGLPAIAEDFAELAGLAGRPAARAAAQARARLVRRLPLVAGRGACKHPDGTVRFAQSALAVFADEVASHGRGAPCRGAGRPTVLPLPGRRSREWAS